jgi:hypothetical protein
MPWTLSPSDQNAYVHEIETMIDTVGRRVSPLTMYQTTEPTAQERIDIWTQIKGGAYSPALYEMLQWVEPSTNVLKNQYQRLNDLSATSSSQKMLPIIEFPSGNIPYTKLGEIQIGETPGTATQLLSDIDQSYRHLLCYIQYRSTAAAATANLLLRVNASAAASYSLQYQSPNSGVALNAEQISATAWSFTVPANTSARTYYHEGLLFLPDYNLTTRQVRMFYRGCYASGAPHTVATTNAFFASGIFSSAVAVTSLQFVGTTGVDAGTRIVLFGI